MRTSYGSRVSGPAPRNSSVTRTSNRPVDRSRSASIGVTVRQSWCMSVWPVTISARRRAPPSPRSRAPWSGMSGPLAEQLAEQLVLAGDHVPAADRIGVGVALPLAGDVAGVAAVDQDVEDGGVVDGGFLAVVIDAVELGVGMDDAVHDLAPAARVLPAVHGEHHLELAHVGRRGPQRGC